jgi:hypothetical protein
MAKLGVDPVLLKNGCNRICYVVSKTLKSDAPFHSGVARILHLGRHGNEAPKASRRDAEGVEGEGLGRGMPLPSRLGGLGERRKLPSGVRGGAPAASEIGAFS